MTSSLYSAPRDMPRDFTTKPVALATMDCSDLNDSPQAAQLVNVVELADFHDVIFVFGATRHAPRFHDKTSCVSDDGLFRSQRFPPSGAARQCCRACRFS